MNTSDRAAPAFFAIVLIMIGFAGLFFHFFGDSFVNFTTWMLKNPVITASGSICVGFVILFFVVKK